MPVVFTDAGLFKFPSEGSTGDPAATLTDNRRFRRLLTCHPGWFPKLHELPGMSKDSTLASRPEWDMSVNGAVPGASMHG